MRDADHGYLVCDQPDVNRYIANPGMHTLDKHDVVHVGIHYLPVVDGDVLALVFEEQLWQQAKECFVFALSFAKLARRCFDFMG